ncbi:hypothetical protein Glove_109g323 [Diversispora epigaea]|uniref:Uncharacterized protein n=1 Tax=Diversispora epigaea TaxID=1348612 RepID=A0A397J6G2_9GLOM|nr:hypothetical protein Glove_109g323 [Diversispora epigaea]
MIQSNFNLIGLLIAWIIIFSLTSSLSGFRIFTHNETNPFETIPRIRQYAKYFDGTVVIRIANRNSNKTSSSLDVWVKPVLSLRIIHPNGTVNEIEKDLEIPEFNWHITTSPDGAFLDPISIYALHKGFLHVSYFDASNPDDITTYEEWGRLLIAWIIIFSLTSSLSGFRIFTHNETNPFETIPRIRQYAKYFDGTVVIRIANRNSNKTSSSLDVWVKPVLSLRIIHPNGTVNEIEKDLEIPEFNWHITTSPDGAFLDPISIYALHKGFLHVSYFDASNPDDITTYEEWGRIIDWNGNLYDKVKFSKAYIENGIWYPSVTSIVANIDPKKGFIRTAGINETYIKWQQYMIDNSFNFKNLSEGNIALPPNTSTIINTIATVDGGYSIIMGNSTNSTNSDSLFEIYATVYDLKIGYNDTQFSAKLLYQLPLPNITISNMFCGISSTGVGQFCTLGVIQNVTQNNVTSSKNYYLKLDFLLSGSVTKITPISNLPELPSNSTTGWLVESIPFGGYLFFGYFLDAANNTNAYGYYFNESANEFDKWDFPEPLVLNSRGTLIILPNNTLLASPIETLNTWSFNTTVMPNYSGNMDHGYSNILVDSTSPSINANISNISTLTDMGNITITYYEPVELSDGNIWIYRIDNSINNNNDNVTRQFVNSHNNEFCYISDNGLTVTIKVIRSTFSYPSSKFYVKVDNNFVRSKVFGEPLMGINDNIWNFNTNPREETFADTVSGVMRLTAEGTEYYENLNSTGKDQFFTNLHLELSKIIPVNIKRLSSNKKTQVDNTLPSRQIFISLDIESSEERSVASIIDDLNDMIKYKIITSIGLFPTTKYLDEDYGFKPKQNLWDKYKFRFLSVILVIAILVVLFLIAQERESKGRNIAVLKLGLIIFDFVMDILFVSENGKVIEVLYIPSIIFLTVPIAVNTIWAFYVISDENKSKTFFDWFTKHEKVASLFTVISSADIEVLSILHSNAAGFKFFQAPISTNGKNRIFWASCLTVFIEDMPQVIIQILYQQSVVTYDIIPLLTLVSSSLSLLINIVGRLFQAINSCQSETLEFDGTPSAERNFTSDESISYSIDAVEENSNDKKSGLVSFVLEIFCM